MKRIIKRWLDIPDVYKQIEGCKNCNGINSQEIVELKKELDRLTTTTFGDRTNKLVEKMMGELYAIKNFLEIDVVEEQQEDKSWAEFNRSNDDDQQIIIPNPAELNTPLEGDLSYELRKGTEK